MKRNIAVIFGGRSSEHEVSCMSAANIISWIDKSRWNIIPIGITKEGKWLNTEKLDDIRSGNWVNSGVTAELSPDATRKSVIMTDPDGTVTDVPVDVIFPALHGKLGEDGTIQGLFEMADIPYVGCGVLSSAVCMDKFYTKLIVEDIAAEANIRQASFVGIREYEARDMNALVAKVESKLSYPVFVKPSRGGSSCGVTKALDSFQLIKGIEKALEIDSKVLVEEFVRGHEVECAVFGGGLEKPVASGVGEILAAAEFYDYDAKYNDPDSVTVTDPELPGNATETIRRAAVRIFNALDCYGLARVDFFVKEDGEVIFNEINTLPGFTAISMYPKLWEARGIAPTELVEKLIDNAFERYHETER